MNKVISIAVQHSGLTNGLGVCANVFVQVIFVEGKYVMSVADSESEGNVIESGADFSAVESMALARAIESGISASGLFRAVKKARETVQLFERSLDVEV